MKSTVLWIHELRISTAGQHGSIAEYVYAQLYGTRETNCVDTSSNTGTRVPL